VCGTKPVVRQGVSEYVNSPTTDLFRKTDLPHGLTADTTEKLRGGADLVIVEGPMDAHAITPRAAADGLDLVAVAPLGAALTAHSSPPSTPSPRSPTAT